MIQVLYYSLTIVPLSFSNDDEGILNATESKLIIYPH